MPLAGHRRISLHTPMVSWLAVEADVYAVTAVKIVSSYSQSSMLGFGIRSAGFPQLSLPLHWS